MADLGTMLFFHYLSTKHDCIFNLRNSAGERKLAYHLKPGPGGASVHVAVLTHRPMRSYSPRLARKLVPTYPIILRHMTVVRI